MQSLSFASTVSSYEAVDALRMWCDVVYKEIVDLMREKGISRGFKFDKQKFLKMIYYYNGEIVNFPNEPNRAFEEVLTQLTKATTLSRGEITRIMNSSKRRVVSKPVNKTPSLEIKTNGNSSTIKVGNLGINNIPTFVSNRLQQDVKGDARKIVRLIIRYFSLGVESGFFWSMDLDIYRMIVQKSPLPVLEGFGSPFNHILSNYCSAYNEDIDFGSKGNFFKYVERLNEPVCLVANPPYIENVMNAAIDTVIEYLDRVPGAEALMMVPKWTNPMMSGLEKAARYPQFAHFIAEKNTHVVYNYHSGENISAGNLSLIFIQMWSPGHTPNIDLKEVEAKMLEGYQKLAYGMNNVDVILPRDVELPAFPTGERTTQDEYIPDIEYSGSPSTVA